MLSLLNALADHFLQVILPGGFLKVPGLPAALHRRIARVARERLRRLVLFVDRRRQVFAVQLASRAGAVGRSHGATLDLSNLGRSAPDLGG